MAQELKSGINKIFTDPDADHAREFFRHKSRAMKSKLSTPEEVVRTMIKDGDYIAVGGYVQYTPSYLNMGAPGTYFAGTAKLTAPATWLPNGIGAYASGELGRQVLGSNKIDNWVYTVSTDLPDYTTWNVGLGFTWKVFTLDLRYSGTDLSKENCFILTGDPGAIGGGATSTLNPAWGLATATTDANGNLTELRYDGLGRLIRVYDTDRSRADGESPTTKYTYTVSRTAPSVVKTETLNNGREYTDSYLIYDGLLRTRQVQSHAASSYSDRVVKETVSYTHLRAHETVLDLVCRLLLEKKKQKHQICT